jgi:hypothetical protein
MLIHESDGRSPAVVWKKDVKIIERTNLRDVHTTNNNLPWLLLRYFNEIINDNMIHFRDTL